MICMVSGLVLTSPFVFYQIWAFIAAGLYRHERHYVKKFLPFSLGLFLSGVFLCFFGVLPYTLQFLLQFNVWMGIEPTMRITDWMSFATILPLVFGVCFQTPLVMLFLERIGILTADDFRKKRKIAILVMVIAAAILTPGPDVFSQVMLAVADDPALRTRADHDRFQQGQDARARQVVTEQEELVRNERARRDGLPRRSRAGRSRLAHSARTRSPGLKAEVIVYDHLASSRLLDLAPKDALRISAGKSIGHCTMSQDEINAVLVEHARLGRWVVRLKGGDPFVFGRGAEEAEHLRRHGLPFQVVPGVTAALGATSYAGIPVTHRDAASAVAFVTGHDDPETSSRLDWPRLARFPGTLVVYMGVTRLAALCRTLIREGKPPETPAAMVQSGYLAESKDGLRDPRGTPRSSGRGRNRTARPAGRRRRGRPTARAELVREASPLRPADRGHSSV